MDKDFSADAGSEALPSIATLERYVGGEMATDERERLEAQIAKDPLLADAVEGLRMSLGEADHTARLSRIRSRVASSVEAMPQTESLGSKRKSRVKPFPQYLVYTAVAAGFALLLVFVGLMRNGENSEDAQNSELITQNQPNTPPTETEDLPEPTSPEPETQVISPLTEESIDNASQPAQARNSRPDPIREQPAQSFDLADNDGVEEFSDEEEELSVGTEDDMIPPAPQVQQLPEPTSVNIPDPAYEQPAPVAGEATQSRQQEELAKLTETAVREETEVIREPTRPASAPVVPAERTRRNQYSTPQTDFSTDDLEYQDEADQTAGAVSKAQLMADLLAEAIRLHDKAELDSAQFFLDEVLLSEPNNIVAAYYKGKALVAQEAFTEAISFLLTSTEVESSPVFEDARWQLAKAYLGAGKKRKARSLLATISEDSGKYQAEAAEILENMD